MTQPFRLRRTVLRIAVLSALLPLSGLTPAADTPDASALLASTDAIRFPQESFQVDIDIESRQNEGEPADHHRYRVLSKGREDTVVLTMEPSSERGQILLMKHRDLWIFMPSVSQPVRLSLAQRLTGQVANGDLARANFTGDYTAKYLREEAIDGKPAHVLELTAVDEGVTYAKVEYWIDTATTRPIKAAFYAISGRLLKTCEYMDYKEMAGAVRPTRLVMTDALKAGNVSTMSYSAMNPRPLPDKLFTKEYLKKLN
ncbi:outer membrane lipoprotein-sorting protein [Zoogloeaceae bacterium G21618-S1]|nr:outer membrane lipoprotein-sorting protein [Zoogloeaceae bacterium G21618-S1]